MTPYTPQYEHKLKSAMLSLTTLPKDAVADCEYLLAVPAVTDGRSQGQLSAEAASSTCHESTLSFTTKFLLFVFIAFFDENLFMLTVAAGYKVFYFPGGVVRFFSMIYCKYNLKKLIFFKFPISPAEELYFGSKETGEKKCLIVLTNVTKNVVAFKVSALCLVWFDNCVTFLFSVRRKNTIKSVLQTKFFIV